MPCTARPSRPKRFGSARSRLGLALLSGAMLGMAFLPAPLGFLAWLGFVPLLVALDHLLRQEVSADHSPTPLSDPLAGTALPVAVLGFIPTGMIRAILRSGARGRALFGLGYVFGLAFFLIG